jgi:hypothetical protein
VGIRKDMNLLDGEPLAAAGDYVGSSSLAEGRIAIPMPHSSYSLASRAFYNKMWIDTFSSSPFFIVKDSCRLAGT